MRKHSLPRPIPVSNASTLCVLALLFSVGDTQFSIASREMRWKWSYPAASGPL